MALPPPEPAEGGVFSLDRLREWAEDLAVRAGLSGLPSGRQMAVVAACALLALWALWRWIPAGAEGDDAGVPVDGPPSAEQTVTEDSAEPTRPATLTVHVVGAVRRPGVYVLPCGARACEAVEAAGGLLGSAEQQAVNLARVLTDGEQLVVPVKGQAGAAPAGGSAAAGGAAAGAGAVAGGKIDLNSAGVTELDALPGVGPSTAKKIVDDRTANGPFRAVEDLLRVPGIGPAKLDALKDLVTVG